MPIDTRRIEAIAGVVRAVFDDLRREGMCKDWSSDLGGACTTASAVLHRALRRRGVRAVIVWGEFVPSGVLEDHGIPHFWVQVGKWIVDVTATQFEPTWPRVYIAKGDRRYVEEHRGRIALLAASSDCVGQVGISLASKRVERRLARVGL